MANLFSYHGGYVRVKCFRRHCTLTLQSDKWQAILTFRVWEASKTLRAWGTLQTICLFQSQKPQIIIQILKTKPQVKPPIKTKYGQVINVQNKISHNSYTKVNIYAYWLPILIIYPSDLTYRATRIEGNGSSRDRGNEKSANSSVVAVH